MAAPSYPRSIEREFATKAAPLNQAYREDRCYAGIGQPSPRANWPNESGSRRRMSACPFPQRFLQFCRHHL